MFSKIKRKLSRAKSVPDSTFAAPQKWQEEDELTLSPSCEDLILRLKSAPQQPQSARASRHVPPVEPAHTVRAVINPVGSGLLALPTELLLALNAYLSPSSEVALRHACSRFYYLYSMPSFYLSGEDKFNFVCMTERDQGPHQLDRLVCGHCREIHPRWTYPRAEIAQAPLDRDCRQIWLCAHRHMGYQKTIKAIKAGAEAPFRTEVLDPCPQCRELIRNRSVADRPEKGTHMMDLESPRSESLLISKIALMQRPAPSYNTRSVNNGSGVYKEMFGAKEVSDALQAINFRICPHIRLGDPCILSKFCRACTTTQQLPSGVKGPPCISNWNRESRDRVQPGMKCKGSCFDRQCRTKFMFQTRESFQPDASGKRPVWLFIVVYRWLGPLLSSGSDLTYTAHTTTHQERGEMRRDWEKWEKTSTHRPMANWSISLLHSEDCNLR